MNIIDSNVWLDLEFKAATSGSLAARHAVPNLTKRLYCAVGRDKRRHFFIPISEGDKGVLDDSSRGLTVRTVSISIAGQQRVKCIDLECNDKIGHEPFDLIGSHVAQLLNENKLQAGEVIGRVLLRWRRFWGKMPRQVLSREQILKLFGDIWFLHNWLMPAFGVGAIPWWRSPFGGCHTFKETNRSIIVNATNSAGGRLHRIDGLEQLETPANLSLFLFSLRLRDEVTGQNLPVLINKCMETLTPHPSELAQFEIALDRVGYLSTAASEYMNIRFLVVEECLFRVHKDFPRITPANFNNGVPVGVEQNNYWINLNSFDHLCVARSPNKAFF